MFIKFLNISSYFSRRLLHEVHQLTLVEARQLHELFRLLLHVLFIDLKMDRLKL